MGISHVIPPYTSLSESDEWNFIFFPWCQFRLLIVSISKHRRIRTCINSYKDVLSQKSLHNFSHKLFPTVWPHNSQIRIQGISSCHKCSISTCTFIRIFKEMANCLSIVYHEVILDRLRPIQPFHMVESTLKRWISRSPDFDSISFHFGLTFQLQVSHPQIYLSLIQGKCTSIHKRD